MITNGQKILMILFLAISAITSLTILTLTVNANYQRQRARSERKEILCVLRILPEDRNNHPELVDACAERV